MAWYVLYRQNPKVLTVFGFEGTFWDFHKVIEPLTNPPIGQPASVPGQMNKLIDSGLTLL